MPYYIKHCSLLTFEVFIVEAINSIEAEGKDGKYLGSFDEDQGANKLYGPFQSDEQALESIEAWCQ